MARESREGLAGEMLSTERVALKVRGDQGMLSSGTRGEGAAGLGWGWAVASDPPVPHKSTKTPPKKSNNK